jgi:hypothetical protein
MKRKLTYILAVPRFLFLVLLIPFTLCFGTWVNSAATLTPTPVPGSLLISEIRTSGLNGSGDEFVELYNNSDMALTVMASDTSAGFGLFKMGADCNATPMLIGTIPNGTMIPARRHYLFVGSAYSLANYGGTGGCRRRRCTCSRY